MKTLITLAAFLGLVCSASAAPAYDPAAEFFAASNPGGVWSYGYSTTLGSPLILHAESGSGSGLDYWRTNLGLSVPWVVHNPTALPVSIGTPVLEPGALSLHPGPGGEYSLVRFTAPATGVIGVSGSFFGQDIVGTSTDVHILRNGVSVYDSAVSGFGPASASAFNLTLAMNSNDTLDFAVGTGPGGNFLYDSTGLAALISAAPEMDCPDHLLHFERPPGRPLLARWNAAAGTVQLMRSTSLGPLSWVPVPAPQLAADGFWESEVGGAARAFFQLQPVTVPASAPAHVRLVIEGDHFRLEWDSACEAAGYIVYIGTTPGVGPGNYTQRVILGEVNALIIEGLTAGQLYYLTLVHVNNIGVGPAAPVQAAVFGPNGPVTGRTLRSLTQQSGQSFEVQTEGVDVRLTPASGGGLTYTGTSDRRGDVFIPHVPVGSYTLAWNWAGNNGPGPSPVIVTARGGSFSSINVQPASSGSTLFGTVRLSNGRLPALDQEAFNLQLRATVTATGANGVPHTMQPDERGRWLLRDLPPAAFPVTLTASFAGFQTTTTVNAPPPALNPIALVFTQIVPRVVKVRTMQNGIETQAIQAGVPVTFEAEIENPSGLPLTPRWTIEHNGQTRTATGASATFTFTKTTPPPGSGGGEAMDGGLARARVSAGDLDQDISFADRAVVDNNLTAACYSGRVAVWDPALPDTLSAAHPATVTLSRNTGTPQVQSFTTSVHTTTSELGGYFEAAVNPTSAPPYRVRVEKTGFMRFFWPFESRLPNEAQFCLVPLQTTLRNYSADPVTYAGNGAQVLLPAGSLLNAAGQPHAGQFTVSMVSFDPTVRSPLPPGAERRTIGAGGAVSGRASLKLLGLTWINITDLAGNPLTPTGGATLTMPINASTGTPVALEASVQDETTGYFNTLTPAFLASGSTYSLPLTVNGLHVIHRTGDSNNLEIEADRTINYPFDVLIAGSIFPITIEGLNTTSVGNFTAPKDETVRIKVIDPGQAPGIFFDNPGSPGPAVVSFNKRLVVSKIITPTATFSGIGIAGGAPTHKVDVSLSDNAPELAPRIGDIDDDNFFLTRQRNFGPAADAYYDKILAPDTLAEWRALNSFPVRFGDPMPNIPADNYATAYYYNLGDLGFARAQTMRIKTGSDGQKDIAFAVTNYRSLEDARCGRGAIATVCMDYALRTDKLEASPARYTRFYVYDNTGTRIGGADLDNSGKNKFAPNLCVMCHGGEPYSAGGTTNLGSKFLPFDLGAYSYHPRWGVQQTELARMNNGVILTNTSGAIIDLIGGWYGTPTPTASPNTFVDDYVPSPGPAFVWNTSPITSDLYQNVFKASCRGCHISRTGGGVQFGSYADMSAFGFGGTNACDTLNMPQSQRTWNIFWGSRSGHAISPAVFDMPTYLHSKSGGVGLCPAP